MTSYLAAYGTISRVTSETIDQVMSLKAKIKGKCFGSSRSLQEEVRKLYERDVTERLQLISRLIVDLGTNRPARFASALSRLWLNLADVSDQMIDILYIPGYRGLQKVVVAQLDHIQRSLTYFQRKVTKKEEPVTFNINYHLRDIALVVSPYRSGFVPMGDERMVELEFKEKLDEAVPHMVGDSEAIYLALYHMVDNAVIAVGAQGTVSMYTKFHDRFKQLQVAVADTGKGIDRKGVLKSALEAEVLNPKQAGKIRKDKADHNNRIFELIFKPRVSTFACEDKSHKGIGLTLAIEEISRHGGKIDIHSKPDRGTTFQIYLSIK